MSMVNDFLEWVGKDPDAAAKSLGTFPSIVNRWLSGSHQPPLKFIEKWMEIKDGKAQAPEAPKAAQKRKPSAVVVKVAPPIPEAPAESPPEDIVPAKEEPKAPEPAPVLNGEWQGRNLMVLFPCYKFTNPATAWSLVALALDFGKEKIRFEQELGDAVISHSRDRLADKFLKSGCEWSLWIDDDIIIPIGRPEWFRSMGRLPPEYPKEAMAYHTVHRLMSHKKTIVGATYFGRHPAGPPMFSEMFRPDAVRNARAFKNEIVPMDWVATGCLLVHRQVYLDIQKKFPELAPKEDDPLVKEFQFFHPDPGQGEDTAFCRRAKAAGHQVYVDTGLHVLHVGTMSYSSLNTGQAG